MHLHLPSDDPLIVRKYSIGTVDLKIQNKTALQKELGWPSEPKRPMLCLPAGMTDKLGGKLLAELLPGLLSLQMEILVLGKGSASYGALFTKLAKENGHRIHIVAEDDREIRMMYAAADMALFLADPKGMKEPELCLRYGVVPLAPATDGLEDYNPVQETGNAFLFEQPDAWNAFAAVVRACETYKFPFDWRTIQRHCMESLSGRDRGEQ
ncbi:MAG: hypothetical protein PHW10_01040 [Candidatus Peribacteraceae bacterium]|nr:hypothetical protein [Candidatus Peribacteraceae bacterium]